MTVPAAQAPAVLYFLGDVYLPHAVRVVGEMPGRLVYNLEAPITQATRGWPHTVNLRCTEDHGAETFGAPALAVCLANNHIMDFGGTGLEDTLRHLSSAGIGFYGAGPAETRSGNPLLLDVGRQRVALMGYVCPTAHPVFAEPGRHPGVAPIAVERIREDAQRARDAGATRIVVSLHWGEEEVELPRAEDVATAREIAALGVDLIIGHHAHCVQPFEVHGGVPIFYGLGNAIFPDVDSWSDFDDDGRPGRRFVKRQNYWNRPSLAVAYDVETGAVRVDRWTCDGKTLRLVRRGVNDPTLQPGTLDDLARRFRRRRFRAVWRNKIVNYARRPRLPRLRHLRSLMRILAEARGSG